MNTEQNWTYTSITPSMIEAAVRQARQERAEAMRQTLIKVPGLIKRLIAAIRPNRPAAAAGGRLGLISR